MCASLSQLYCFSKHIKTFNLFIYLTKLSSINYIKIASQLQFWSQGSKYTGEGRVYYVAIFRAVQTGLRYQSSPFPRPGGAPLALYMACLAPPLLNTILIFFLDFSLSLSLVNSCLIFCTFSSPRRRFLKSAFNALFVFSPCGM